jgi:drug/metabolite transporter (DMT)-like permease
LFEYHASALNREDQTALSGKTLSPTARVAVGAFLISFSPVFVKVVDVGPAATAFYRLLIGGAVLLAVALTRGRRKPLSPKSIVLASVCGLIVALDLTVWHLSIQLIGPGLATILGNHQIFVLSAFGLLFLGERLTVRLGMAIVLAMLGLFLIFGLEWGEFDAGFRLGVVFGALTALLYATFLLVLRHVQSGSEAPASVVTVAILSIVGAFVLALYVWLGNESFVVPDIGSWTVLAAYAILSHVIGWVLISTGLPGLAASRAGLVLLLQPALAFVWDVMLFDRPTAVIEVLGAVLALTAIYLGTARGGNRTAAKAA